MGKYEVFHRWKDSTEWFPLVTHGDSDFNFPTSANFLFSQTGWSPMSMNEDNHDTEAWLRSRTSRAGGWKMGFSSSVGWPHPHILHILNIYNMNMYDTFSVLILFTCASREMAVQIEHWLHLLLIHPPQSLHSPIPPFPFMFIMLLSPFDFFKLHMA